VVVSPGGEEATMLALNKKTGDVVWKSPLESGEPAGYASIIIVEAVGVKQYVQFLGKGLVGVDAETGKFLWRYDHTSQGSAANIFTPVAGDDHIYTGTTYTGGGLVRLTRDADGIKADEVYYEKKLPTAIGGAVLLDGSLYGTNRESIFCVDFKTGDVIWKKDRRMSPASLCYADGRLYLHGDTEGDVGLVEATTAGYRELGHFTPPDIPERQGKSWSYPVVANGRLYIHDWGTLWCYDIKAPPERRAAARTTKPDRN
jgi:outer membrane protein assembly factor BamB